MKTPSIFDLDVFAEQSILTSTMSTQAYQKLLHSVSPVPAEAMVCLLQEEPTERPQALCLDPLRLRA